VGLKEIKVVWINTWVIEKMALKVGAGRGDGMRCKKGVRCGGCRVMGS
jgi:hypothetical protein